MTLTPSAVRSDLKCGKGAISKGEKCTKGSATPAKSSTDKKERAKNAARIVGATTAVGIGALGAYVALSARRTHRYTENSRARRQQAAEARIANMERTQREVAATNRANVPSDFMRGYGSQSGASSTRPTTNQSVYSPPKGSVEAKVQAAFTSTVPYPSAASNDPNPDISAAWVKLKEPKRRNPYKGDPDLSGVWASGFQP